MDEVVVVDDVLSSGFDDPKLKLPLEVLLSALDDPVPNVTPPLDPNLNAETAAGGSDFLLSLEEVPNLKLSEEPPYLNPDEPTASSEAVSDEELPNCTPNLNPPDEEEASANELPNLKPSDPEPEELSVVPNVNAPELEVEEPNVEELEVPPAVKTKDKKK